MAHIDDDFFRLVSERYVDAYHNGCIGEFSHCAPYNFAFLYDFWKPDFYKLLCEYHQSMNAAYNPEGDNTTKIYYEPFDMDLFVNFVYGNTFRTFLAALVGASTFVRPKECYPQLRATKSNASGLSIHTDEKAPYNGVAFFHLNDNWLKGYGGEFVVWERIADGRYRKRYEFSPLGNSLSVLLLNEKSFHSVNTSYGNWVRKNILMEVQFQ
ncbi:hypothetical protein HV336_14945 [Citrobacter freundii]|uniref:hypothetical protein n=1 Tax=Citrobacter freundii complex TaxID=1344959 RepID=UPI000F454BA9|nr:MULTISPECIES: hypothetical protein [Citrobacter freundii complex]RNL75676.1 hypothetical protein D7I40_00580 [Citrobacter sp. MH181794]MBA8419281.1 hypothetical protein [Citrobacter freundii]MDE9612546.1 hypothetical protein [Citrobacter portucalensis]QLR78082.1 hypothetical protein HV336_14945 [Citrobacter freundii]QMM95625.1 hypothetical protein HVW92_15135 [Citrobacter freundii]